MSDIDQFAFQGYSLSGVITCAVDGDTIYQTDYLGNRKAIGKTSAAYDDLAATTQQYYDKLVELGVIIPEKAAEEIISDMQSTMLEMTRIIAALSDEVKEIKNGHKQCACDSEPDVPERKSERRGAKGTASDKRDSGQP